MGTAKTGGVADIKWGKYCQKFRPRRKDARSDPKTQRIRFGNLNKTRDCASLEICGHYWKPSQFTWHVWYLLTFKQVLKEYNYNEGPTDGSYVNGLYLDGARWDRQRHVATIGVCAIELNSFLHIYLRFNYVTCHCVIPKQTKFLVLTRE